MTKDSDYLKLRDFIAAFEGWDFDRQTKAIDVILDLGDQFPHEAVTFGEMAAIMTLMRDKAHPERTAA